MQEISAIYVPAATSLKKMLLSCEEPIGKRRWAIAEGYIPAESHAANRDMISHEALSFVNTGPAPAKVALWILYRDRAPLGPFNLVVEARRSLHKRINELKDPGTVPKAVEFSMLVESDQPIVVQHTRLDSRQDANAIMTTIGYCEG